MKRRMFTLVISILLIFSMFVPIVANETEESGPSVSKPTVIETTEPVTDINGDDNSSDLTLVTDEDQSTVVVDDTDINEPDDNNIVQETNDSNSADDIDGDDDTSNGNILVQNKELENEQVEDDSSNIVTVTKSKDDTFSKSYLSISEAIEEIEEYSYSTNKDVYTIKLNTDINDDVVIPSNRNITIDLNGHSLTNINGHTITNNSTRTIITDTSEEQTGVVDNLTHGKGAVYNNINASITIKGGTFTRSKENSINGDESGDNSWYVIKNFGTMTINSPTIVKFSDSNPGYYSSLIGNGWQNSASAEVGNSNEPKPSEGKNKATLTIRGGTFQGGKIVVKNDDYGELKIEGGSIVQNTDKYFAVYNANTAEITGGTITSTNGSAVGNDYFEGAANAGKLSITGGTFSGGYDVIQTNSGSALTITNGSFDCTNDDSFIINAEEDANAEISGGTFNCTADKLSSRSDVFKDGYLPQEGSDGSLIVKEDPNESEAKVVDVDGSEKYYLTLSSALSNASCGSKVYLLKDVVLSKKAESKQFGVTLDLNGYSIDGSAIRAGNPAVILGTIYTAKPVEGINNTITLTNSKDTGGEIKADIPLQFKCGDSSKELPIDITGNINLVSRSGKDPVSLGSSAYLVYSEKTASYFSNGMFKVTDSQGIERIYGNYANAAKVSSNGIVTLLHDYSGSQKIDSGSKSIILDLNGHEYTYTGKEYAVDVNNSKVKLTIKNGSIVSNADGAHLIGAFDTMNNRSLVLDNVRMIVNGEYAYGIVTNGTEENNSIELIDSSLTVENGFGIYFPSSGNVSIENSQISAKYVGVQMCAGNLTVKGSGTYIGTTNEPLEKTESDGVISDGAAISIVERDGYKDLGTIVIEDGVFSSKNSNAVKTYAFNNTDKTEGEWPNSNETVAINGGTYSDLSPIDNISEGADIDIVLNKDIELSNGENISIPASTTVDIDLNGHSINTDETTDPSITVAGELNLLNSGDSGKINVKVLVNENGKLGYDPRTIDKGNIIDENNGTSILINTDIKVDAEGVSIGQDEILKIRNAIENLINEDEQKGLVFSDPTAIQAIKEALANGTYMHIEISITDNVREDAKASILNRYPTSEKFFDITISVVIEGASDVKYKIEELPSAVNIEVKIPNEMIANNRDYFVVREHKGVISNISYLKDLDGDGFAEFSSNKFSTYAIAYSVRTSDDDHSSHNRPSRYPKPDKDTPSNTKECQKMYGEDVIYSNELKACVYKYLVVVDTSAK